MRVIIVRADIGLISFAQSLRRAGTVYLMVDQANAFGEIGTGVQLSLNAEKVQEWLGVQDYPSNLAREQDAHKSKEWGNGQTILQTPLS